MKNSYLSNKILNPTENGEIALSVDNNIEKDG